MQIGCVLVIVNEAEDKGVTRGLLAEIKDARLVIIEMYDGYSWSNALNRGLLYLLLRQRGVELFRYLFILSVEALFETEHLDAMLCSFVSDPLLRIIGTTFVGQQDGRPIELGHSYSEPRNTGLLLSCVGFGTEWIGFDPDCDRIGGMEDFNLVMFIRRWSGHHAVQMLDLRVPLLLGKHVQQEVKEARERRAMDQIKKRWQ